MHLASREGFLGIYFLRQARNVKGCIFEDSGPLV
jgi:hypothetical protein